MILLECRWSKDVEAIQQFEVCLQSAIIGDIRSKVLHALLQRMEVSLFSLINILHKKCKEAVTVTSIIEI